MENILVQKYTYATIIPFKDYSNISEKIEIPKGVIKIIYPKEKRKIKYFTSDTNEKINGLFKHLINKDIDGSYHTTSDKQIKRHYGRPFSSIKIITIERSIKRNGDNLTIKILQHIKSRDFNCLYFRKVYNVDSITINLKTGNITTISINKNKKINKIFRRNSFYTLNNLIINRFFFNLKVYFPYNFRFQKDVDFIFDKLSFTNAIQQSLGIEISIIPYESNPLQFITDLCKVFVNLKNIKIPNDNFEYLLTQYYPTEKFLKKNDRKLLTSILDMFGIKSKLTIKILHKYPKLDIIGFFRICKLFGDDFSKYIGNIKSHVFEKSLKEPNFDNNYYHKNTLLIDKEKSYQISNKEKENLVKIINSTEDKNLFATTTSFSDSFALLLEDHFNMIEKIKVYDPDLHMKAKTIKEFNDEHHELSKMVFAIKKGWVTEYLFNEKMVNDIEKPIPLKINLGGESNPTYGQDLGISFYPIILKREEEYIEEGKFMHHCVATYADKEKSIIISVRTEDGSDRVTCEFNCQTGTLLQARHFCNGKPPADIEHVILNELSEKTKKYARLGLLHASEKLKVPLKINGVEVKKQEPSKLFGVYLDDFI